MNIYCTLFDRNYITRGLALYDSLARTGRQFTLVVLCLDDATQEILQLLTLPHARLVSLRLLGKTDTELTRVRPHRTDAEFYFTCKPVLMRLIAEEYGAAQRVTYLDADLFYFSDPVLLERKYDGSSVALTPHKFPSRLSERVMYGYFNAGWVSASTDTEGRRFIDWWRARCIDWCRLKVQPERFGDQKYLDEVPSLFRDVCLLDDAGANLAPWNLGGVSVNESDGQLAVNGGPLHFFHFHGLKKILGRIYDSGLHDYTVALAPLVRRRIYHPYLANLSDRDAQLKQLYRKGELFEQAPATTSPQVLFQRLKHAVRVVANRTCVIGP